MATRIPYKQIEAIPGWFRRMDMELFRLLLDADRGAPRRRRPGGARCLPGQERSADGLQPAAGRDLHGDRPVRAARRPRMTTSRRTRSSTPSSRRRRSRATTGRSTTSSRWWSGHRARRSCEHAAHGTHRFVHIDASHLYEHVVADIAAARTLLKPGGVVVFDDYRAPHTPGVAAAVWRETTEDLTPFAVTQNKLYATFGEADHWLEAAQGLAGGRSLLADGAAAGRRARAGPGERPAPKPKSGGRASGSSRAAGGEARSARLRLTRR